ncbi:MAG TPA: hypothetical protein VIO60_10245 [Rectinemataceae bacterium]
MILWNAELTKRLSCKAKEKAALIPLVRSLLDLGDAVRSQGIGGLQQNAQSDPLLAYGLKLVAEGVSADALEEILAIFLATSALEGYDFLAQCVSAEALLCLASGDSRELMARKLAPYAGAEAALGLLESLESESAWERP